MSNGFNKLRKSLPASLRDRECCVCGPLTKNYIAMPITGMGCGRCGFLTKSASVFDSLIGQSVFKERAFVAKSKKEHMYIGNDEACVLCGVLKQFEEVECLGWSKSTEQV